MRLLIETKAQINIQKKVCIMIKLKMVVYIQCIAGEGDHLLATTVLETVHFYSHFNLPFLHFMKDINMYTLIQPFLSCVY